MVRSSSSLSSSSSSKGGSVKLPDITKDACGTCRRKWASSNPLKPRTGKEAGHPVHLQRLSAAAAICVGCSGAIRKYPTGTPSELKTLHADPIELDKFVRGPLAIYEASRNGEQYELPADLVPSSRTHGNAVVTTENRDIEYQEACVAHF